MQRTENATDSTPRPLESQTHAPSSFITTLIPTIARVIRSATPRPVLRKWIRPLRPTKQTSNPYYRVFKLPTNRPRSYTPRCIPTLRPTEKPTSATPSRDHLYQTQEELDIDAENRRRFNQEHNRHEESVLQQEREEIDEFLRQIHTARSLETNLIELEASMNATERSEPLSDDEVYSSQSSTEESSLNPEEEETETPIPERKEEREPVRNRVPDVSAGNSEKSRPRSSFAKTMKELSQYEKELFRTIETLKRNPTTKNQNQKPIQKSIQKPNQKSISKPLLTSKTTPKTVESPFTLSATLTSQEGTVRCFCSLDLMKAAQKLFAVFDQDPSRLAECAGCRLFVGSEERRYSATYPCRIAGDASSSPIPHQRGLRRDHRRDSHVIPHSPSDPQRGPSDLSPAPSSALGGVAAIVLSQNQPLQRRSAHAQARGARGGEAPPPAASSRPRARDSLHSPAQSRSERRLSREQTPQHRHREHGHHPLPRDGHGYVARTWAFLPLSPPATLFREIHLLPLRLRDQRNAAIVVPAFFLEKEPILARCDDILSCALACVRCAMREA